MSTAARTGTRARAGGRSPRPLAAVAAVVALACAAACGTGGSTGSGGLGGSGGSGEDGKPSRRATGERTAGGDGRTGAPGRNSHGSGSVDARDTEDPPAASDTPDPRGASGARGAVRPLSGAQLRKAALVTGDVGGYAIDPAGAADLLGRSVPATPRACQPIADLFLFTTAPAPRAAVSRGVGAQDELDASVTTFALLSYGPGDAEEVMDGLRSATRSCTAYRHTGYAYEDVEALPDPDRGDESVAFRLLASIEGARVPVAYTVARRGTTLVAFSSMDMLEEGGAEVPAALVGAQLEKLARTAGRGSG